MTLCINASWFTHLVIISVWLLLVGMLVITGKLWRGVVIVGGRTKAERSRHLSREEKKNTQKEMSMSKCYVSHDIRCSQMWCVQGTAQSCLDYLIHRHLLIRLTRNGKVWRVREESTGLGVWQHQFWQRAFFHFCKTRPILNVLTKPHIWSTSHSLILISLISKAFDTKINASTTLRALRELPVKEIRHTHGKKRIKILSKDKIK